METTVTPSGNALIDGNILDLESRDLEGHYGIGGKKSGGGCTEYHWLVQPWINPRSYPVSNSCLNFKGNCAFLECPTEDYLDALISSPQLQALSSDPDKMPTIVVHMSPAHIITDTRYKEFMSRFGPHTKHLMMNGNSRCLYLKEQHEVQQILHKLHPNTFPALQSHLQYTTKPNIPKGNIVQAFNGLRFKLDNSPRFTIIDHLYFRQTIEKLLQNIPKKVKQQLKKSLEENGDYPEITFLGTNSGLSNTLRNPSGILVQTRQDEYMLLDCGEGTLAQLYQIYGNQTEKVLSNLKIIFLSHLHFDHYGGLHKVIEARAKAIGNTSWGNRLAIIAPKVFVRWICYYERYFDELTSKVRLFTHEELVSHCKANTVDPQIKKMEHSLGLKEIIPVPVLHTSEMSHGVVLKHQDGWKIVYSGDCRPTQELIDTGKACDILIHEGTYPDRRKDTALRRRHCTLSEAVEVADKMEAKMTILTHLSSTTMQEDNTFLDHPKYDQITFAYDLMKVKRSSSKVIPAIKQGIIQTFK